MRPLRLATAFLIAVAPLGGSVRVSASDKTALVATEAVTAALTLPPGYKRDVVLRAVSRNLRWFGQHDAGVRAARAMTDGGVSEVPLGARPAQPRYVPLREAMPTGSPCDAGLWREEDGGEAKTPKAREDWARECLLQRDFHWIGLPEGRTVQAIAAGLPAGEIKGAVLAMLIRAYGDAPTLRFVIGEVDRDATRMPAKVREMLEMLLSEPAVLYRLDRRSEALAAAKVASEFEPKAKLIRLLIVANHPATAVSVLETLASTPPEFGDSCFGWFNSIGGLDLAQLGSARSPAPAIGAFLDQLPASSLFKRICPNGLDAELEVEHLLAAGRLDHAITRARQHYGQPFLLIDALLQAGEVRLRDGARDAARAYAIEAAAALRPCDRGDPVDAKRSSVVMDMNAPVENKATRNFGERSGDTRRRFEVIRLLAATGAVTEADALARKQPAGGLRAVALSAAVAGRAGLRFDDQAPSLSGIEANDL